MTVVVGLVGRDREVCLGGDRSAISAEGLTIDTISHPKVWRTSYSQGRGREVPLVAGACDSFRMLQLLRYSFTWPEDQSWGDPLGYLVSKAIPALRELVEQAGMPGDEDGPNLHGNVLVGFSGRLFVIQSDFAVLEVVRNYAAIGAGASFALGSFYSSNPKHPAESRVYAALYASAEHSFAVRDPFDVVSTGEDA